MEQLSNVPLASDLRKPVAGVRTSSPRDRFCGVCDLPLPARSAVLLKSGQSVHLECYLALPKSPEKRRIRA